MNSSVAEVITDPRCYIGPRNGKKHLTKRDRDKAKEQMRSLKAALWIAKIPILKNDALKSFRTVAPMEHRNRTILNEMDCQEKVRVKHIMKVCVLTALLSFFIPATLRFLRENNLFVTAIFASGSLLFLLYFVKTVHSFHGIIKKNLRRCENIMNGRSADGHQVLDWKQHFILDVDRLKLACGLPTPARLLIQQLQHHRLPADHVIFVEHFGICGILTIQTLDETYYLLAWTSE